MIERFDKWLRVVLLRRTTLVAILLFGIGAWLFLPVLMLLFSFVYFDGEISWELLFRDKDTLHIAFAVAISVVYGVFRGAYFHPLYNTAYGSSLVPTPWRFPASLPLGPVHLVGQDSVVVLVLVLVAALPPTRLQYLYMVPTTLLATYCFVQCLAHVQVGARWSTYSFCFLAGLCLLLFNYPVLCLLTAGLVYLLGRQAIQGTLREFPFSEKQKRGLIRQRSDRTASEVIVPWAAAPLTPLPWYFHIRGIDALCLGAAFGWLMFCLAMREPDDWQMAQFITTIHLFAAVASVVGRCLLYVIGHAPPISISGRLATRRLVIPGYDKVFIAPIISAIVAYVMPTLLIHRFDVSDVLAVPLSTFVTITLALGLPPRWEEWHFRSHCREKFGYSNASRFIRTS